MMGDTLTATVTATVMNVFLLAPSGLPAIDYSTLDYQVIMTETSITYVF